MRTVRHIIFLLLLTYFGATNKLVDKPQLSRLKISECIENYKDPNKILSEIYIDKVYKINFGVLLNCCGQDTLSVKLKGDTLKIRVLPTRKSQRAALENKGDTTWITPFCSCECYYKFDAEIKNLTGRPKFIKVNQTFLR